MEDLKEAGETFTLHTKAEIEEVLSATLRTRAQRADGHADQAD